MPKITWSNHKGFGIEETPPPPVGKNSQIFRIFFLTSSLRDLWLREDCSTVFVYLPAENITSQDFNITSPGVDNLHYLGTLFNMGVSNFL